MFGNKSAGLKEVVTSLSSPNQDTIGKKPSTKWTNPRLRVDLRSRVLTETYFALMRPFPGLR